MGFAVEKQSKNLNLAPTETRFKLNIFKIKFKFNDTFFGYL